jgi:hypothetical protein
LALATLLSRVGNGLLMTISVLYFNRIVGLSIAEIPADTTGVGVLRCRPETPAASLQLLSAGSGNVVAGCDSQATGTCRFSSNRGRVGRGGAGSLLAQ